MENKKNKIVKEKILPAIVLKYYFAPEKNRKEKPSGITCAICLEKNVINTGGGLQDNKGRFHQICERCAIWRYRDDYGFRTLASAKARRRRLFDVGYLFNEMVVDKYMDLNRIKKFEDFNEGVADTIFMNADNLYNYLFSKEDKMRIEEIEDQPEIEIELRKRFGIIDFNKYFHGLGLL